MDRKGISLVAFKEMREVEEAIERFPSCFFELSYAYTREKLEEVLPLIRGKVASVHSLCPRREYFPNFASGDKEVISWSENELLKDAELASNLGADCLVLHPGYLTDELVPTDADKRIRMMEKTFRKYVLDGTSSIARRDYIRGMEYREAFSMMKKHIIEISRKIADKGVKLTIENLNPRAGYMLIHPDEILELSEYEDILFTIDIGHLWVTTELYGLDFLSTLKTILSTGKVINTHLHSNISDGNAFIFEDSHQPLDDNNMPWRKALSLIAASNANMMVEAKYKPLHNLELLFSI